MNIECSNCKTLFRSDDKRSKFCSRSCAAIFNNKNRKVSEETKKKTSQSLIERNKNNPEVFQISNKRGKETNTKELCSYGCGQIARFINKSGNFMCEEFHVKCPELKNKNSIGGKNCYKNGSRNRKKKFTNEEVFIENSFYYRGHIKDRIRKESLKEYVCEICGGLPIWNNKPMVLILDHINGINNDHRLSNLRFVCPNCNSQLDTFTGKNIALVKANKLRLSIEEINASVA